MSGEKSWRRWHATLVRAAVVVALAAAPSVAGTPPGPYSKEYDVTIDPTALRPPTRWYVPGVTPIIATLDPEYTDAYSTAEQRVVKLKPGEYRFGTFTFDFPFVLTLKGTLDYASSLDQCVDGRGTRTLTILCSQTQPYTGQREYFK